MNYNEAISYIHSLGMFSHPAGLERIKRLLNTLGNPQDRFEAVHIAGTNGKGSTAAMTAAALGAAGFKTALFISPFIINFRERIQLNGEFIPEKDLCRLTERVKSTGIAVTEFEFITAVAFLWFDEQKCDIAVIETGLGGRLDATNALTRVRASVITKIGYDHTAVLGNTLAKIAAEKCGIIKGVTVCAPHQPRTAFEVIKGTAPQLIVPDMRRLKVIKSDIFGNDFIYRKTKFHIPLAGIHQTENAVCAIEAVLATGLVKDLAVISKGLAAVKFPARLEVMSHSPLTVIDGAHNPDGAKTLEWAMRPYSGKITAIVGMMKDKNCEEFLSRVLPHCNRVIAVRATDTPRALKADEMAELCKKHCSNTQTADTLPQAIAAAKSGDKECAVFIFGSLYLASGIRPLLLNP